MPPLLHAAPAAEGADLLAEVPGAAGVLLWGALRDLMLWLETEPAARAGLFGAGAGEARRAALASSEVAQELWAPLLTLAQAADAPERADRARLAYAARAVARWAERAGAPGTRLAFTQAAALALPGDAGLALETGKLARDLARHAQAETWLRRAVRLARGREWACYGWAFVGLGVLYMRAGNYPAAQAVFRRALRSGRKHRIAAVQAASLHHLFAVAGERGDFAAAYAHARAAMAAYPAGSPRIPALANDVARLWMEAGQYARALPVLEALAPRVEDANDRVVTLANVALAAAHAGDRARYESARARAAREIGCCVSAALLADAWCVVATADAAAGEWARVEAAAGTAHELATARGEAVALCRAEELLDAARARATPAPAPRAPEPAGSALHAQRLAGELLARIAEPQPA
jgi:tetratricopeptide (TPR) repeat protein